MSLKTGDSRLIDRRAPRGQPWPPVLPEGESPETIAARIARAKEDRAFFYTHYLPHLFSAPLGPNHEALFDKLDAYPLLQVMAFRGWGKSTVVTFAETLWLLVTGRVRFGVLTGRTGQQTKPLVLHLRTELEVNERLIADFGPFPHGAIWQHSRFEVEGRFEVIGRALGETARGLRSLKNQRPQLWVLDDLQELEDGRSPERIDHAVQFVTSVALPGLHQPGTSEPKSLIRVVGTKMSEVYSNFASLMMQESGAPLPSGVWSHGGHIQASSGFAGPGVSSFDSLNVGSLSLSGNRVRQLLQRVYVQDTTSRSSTSAVYSTYTVASLTPVCSQSSILVRAAIYYQIDANATVGQMGSHLVRNPKGSVTSFGYLTTSAAGTAGRPSAMGSIVGQTVQTLSGVMQFEAVDSAGNLDPKQYGVDWNREQGGGATGVYGGTVTLEEWL